MYIHLPAPPPLSFLRFWSFLGLSLRLFRLLLRLVSLPQSRAKYSLFPTPFSLDLLALVFLCFFLLFLRLFRYLFRFLARAPQSGTVCVSTPVPKGAYTQGAGVCFRCLQPMKTHLSHSDIVLGRQNYVPAFFNC